jgi:hypothetical protein
MDEVGEVAGEAVEPLFGRVIMEQHMLDGQKTSTRTGMKMHIRMVFVICKIHSTR